MNWACGWACRARSAISPSACPTSTTRSAFAVDQAETGERRWRMIDQMPPDILLLDHKMPGISGLDVLDRLAGKYGDMLTI